MKWAIMVLVLIWFGCGAAGAWMMGELDKDHLKQIARGPMTLVKAVNDSDVEYPWSTSG
jgi:hypothetical protein